MTPDRREALERLLAEARQASRARAEAIAAASDSELMSLVGIKNAALCRRIAARPRGARRIAAMIEEAEKTRTQTAEDAPVSARVSPEPPAREEIDLSREALPLIAAAIQLSGAGALVSRPELDRIATRFGADAAEFALRSRARVPGWIRAIAGEREDVLRQLAATCIVCAAEDDAAAGLSPPKGGADAHDPLPVTDPGVRRSAAALARDALAFLGGNEPPYAMARGG